MRWREVTASATVAALGWCGAANGYSLLVVVLVGALIGLIEQPWRAAREGASQ